MVFNKKNREALIDELRAAVQELEVARKVHEKMESETSTRDQLFQLVGIKVAEFKVAAIERALIDNNPFQDFEII